MSDSTERTAPNDGRDAAETAETTDNGASVAAPQGKLRGFNIGRFRVSHLRTRAAGGWGQLEGRVIARSLFSLSSLYEGDYHAGYRLVIGPHSFWVMR